jgi:hypothetical protein
MVPNERAKITGIKTMINSFLLLSAHRGVGWNNKNPIGEVFPCED